MAVSLMSIVSQWSDVMNKRSRHVMKRGGSASID